MRTYRLSSSSERIVGTVISLMVALVPGALVWLLRKDIMMLIIMALAGIIVIAMLVLYMVNIYKSACTPLPEERGLEVSGLLGCRLDLSQAVSVESRAMTSGPVTTRVIVFLDEKGEALETVPTFFTVHGGAEAEPLARDLARDLGLSFRETLEPWEYDPEARKAHEEALAAEQKAARREKIAKIKEKFSSGKARAGTEPTPAPKEENGSLEESINYDALDDEK